MFDSRIAQIAFVSLERRELGLPGVRRTESDFAGTLVPVSSNRFSIASKALGNDGQRERSCLSPCCCRNRAEPFIHLIDMRESWLNP